MSLTVSLRSPRLSALWPSRASAVSWKHVTHWLSPKSAKLAWESDSYEMMMMKGREIIYVCSSVCACVGDPRFLLSQQQFALTESMSLYLKLGNSRSHFSQRYSPFCWSMTFLLQPEDGQAWYRQFSLRIYTTVATQLKYSAWTQRRKKRGRNLIMGDGAAWSIKTT